MTSTPLCFSHHVYVHSLNFGGPGNWNNKCKHFSKFNVFFQLSHSVTYISLHIQPRRQPWVFFCWRLYHLIVVWVAFFHLPVCVLMCVHVYTWSLALSQNSLLSDVHRVKRTVPLAQEMSIIRPAQLKSHSAVDWSLHCGCNMNDNSCAGVSDALCLALSLRPIFVQCDTESPKVNLNLTVQSHMILKKKKYNTGWQEWIAHQAVPLEKGLGHKISRQTHLLHRHNSCFLVNLTCSIED